MIKDDVFLVAGNLLSLSRSVNDSWKKDVLDSILFSRLYAGSKSDRFSSARQWHNYYIEAMGQLKWALVSSKSTRFELGDGTNFVLRHLIQDKLATIMVSAQTEQFERLMSATAQGLAEVLTTSAGDNAVVCFSTNNTLELKTFALQLSLVGQGPVVYSAFVHFTTTQDVESDFFNQELLSDMVVGEINIEIVRQVLNKVTYERSRMREKVLSSLPEEKSQLVLELTS
jgi:hypothetical protein